MILQTLAKQNLIHAPKWLPDNTQFIAYTGSVAYGVSNDTSDMDCHGFCIPEKNTVFPHLAGNILGFGTQEQHFRNWQEHGIKTQDGNKEYDFSIYNIVYFFDLAMQNNPNVMELLFLPRRCVLHSTKIAEHVIENRYLFPHKGSMRKFLGYAYSQLSKMKGSTNALTEFMRDHHLGHYIVAEDVEHALLGTYDRNDELCNLSKNDLNKLKELFQRYTLKTNEKRRDNIIQYGYDTKNMYHVVRLCLQAEQILEEGDLDVERNSEILKSIRRGEWSIARLEKWFEDKESTLTLLYSKSTLRNKPDEGKIKKVLMECLEMHYGTISNMVTTETTENSLLKELKKLIANYE